MPETGPYTIPYDGYVLTVTEAYIEDTRVFHVEFSTNVKPINLVVVKGLKGHRGWTSVPRGRQLLADEIGPVIGKYYHDKKK